MEGIRSYSFFPVPIGMYVVAFSKTGFKTYKADIEVVVTYGYSVEFGRSTGGVLNATTKSGTNGFHGSGFLLRTQQCLGLDRRLRS